MSFSDPKEVKKKVLKNTGVDSTVMSRKCLPVGMEDMKEVYKGGLLMTREHFKEQDKSILIAALGGCVSYKKVKHTLLNVFNIKE